LEIEWLEGKGLGSRKSSTNDQMNYRIKVDQMVGN